MILNALERSSRPGWGSRESGFGMEGQLLRWSNTDPTATRLTIPPGSHRYLDLLRVNRPETAAREAPAIIQIYPEPVDQRNRVKSGSFWLELGVTARNTDPRVYRLVVNFDGEWGDDVWSHLRVWTPELINANPLTKAGRIERAGRRGERHTAREIRRKQLLEEADDFLKATEHLGP